MPPNITEDPRLQCVKSDYPISYYRIKGYTDSTIQLDERRQYNPWTVIAVVNGKTIDGHYPIYPTSHEAINAVINGSWRD